jgi:hypothetical protein
VEAAVEDVDAAFLEDKKASPLCIGSEDFRDKIGRLYRDLLGAKPRWEDVAFRRTGGVVDVEGVLDAVCRALAIDRSSLQRRRRDSFDRAIASRMLCDYSGLTQREAAQVLGIANGASVSQQLRKLARAIETDRALHAQVAALAAELKSNLPEP